MWCVFYRKNEKKIPITSIVAATGNACTASTNHAAAAIWRGKQAFGLEEPQYGLSVLGDACPIAKKQE